MEFVPFGDGKEARAIRVADDYHIILPQTDLICLTIGFTKAKGLNWEFDSPNLIRRLERDFEFKHYTNSGKYWTKEAGVDYVFAVPVEQIQVGLEKTYSYPNIVINGYLLSLNTSGGSHANGCWEDYISEHASTAVNHPGTVLEDVSAVAVRGTRFEPYLTRQELEEEFKVKHANDWQVTTAYGDWAWNVPKGFVYVVACVGGRTFTPGQVDKGYLIPKAEYDAPRRYTQFIVDPQKHQAWEPDRTLPYSKPTIKG